MLAAHCGIAEANEAQHALQAEPEELGRKSLTKARSMDDDDSSASCHGQPRRKTKPALHQELPGFPRLMTNAQRALCITQYEGNLACRFLRPHCRMAILQQWERL